jgi:hypothetical protein
MHAKSGWSPSPTSRGVIEVTSGREGIVESEPRRARRDHRGWWGDGVFGRLPPVGCRSDVVGGGDRVGPRLCPGLVGAFGRQRPHPVQPGTEYPDLSVHLRGSRAVRRGDGRRGYGPGCRFQTRREPVSRRRGEAGAGSGGSRSTAPAGWGGGMVVPGANPGTFSPLRHYRCWGCHLWAGGWSSGWLRPADGLPGQGGLVGCRLRGRGGH